MSEVVIDMIVSLEEMKQYLRVDFDEDDSLLEHLIAAGESLCMDIVRIDDAEKFAKEKNARIAVMYAVAYQYEHREDADHHALVLSLRALLFGIRQEGF